MNPRQTIERPYLKRVRALAARASKSPSHVEELRAAAIRRLGLAGTVADRQLLDAIEAYDRAKGGPHR